MGNIPVIQEVVTSFASLGDTICGDTDSARQRWVDYSKESVLGSTFVGIHYNINGDHETAKEYYKGNRAS